MNTRRALCSVVVLFSLSINVGAQTVPNSPATVQMSGYDTRGSGVVAHTNSTMLSFTLEGDTTGNNSFEIVTSDPGVAVSLILPSSLEVTSVNAASLGFTFTTIPEGTVADDQIQLVFSLPGTHTIISVPGGQISGLYNIKANATSVIADSGIIATYYPSSRVRTLASTNSTNYKM
jgi:hypothetical protein